MARIGRAETEGVFVAVADASRSLDGAATQPLREGVVPGSGLDAAFDWLFGCGPPLAALAYIQGEPQNGLDTLAMCLAAVFFAAQMDVESFD